MNERIQELVEQATTEEHDGFRYFDKKKFAELIIEQCCRALNPMLRDMISRGQGQELIRQHFGIEE